MDHSNPKVVEVFLCGEYQIMYDHLLISDGHNVYLLLNKTGDSIAALKFTSRLLKHGAPNDEARGGHPLAKFGLGFYGLYRVENSPWIRELMEANWVHPRHNDASYQKLTHYIACFKDQTLEVIADEMEKITLSTAEVAAHVSKLLGYLEQ